MKHEHYTHTAPDIPSSTFICPSFSPYQQATFASSCIGKFVRYCFCGIPICRPLLSDLHAEIAAVISTPQRHASLPDQLRMQPGIADVITVAKAAAQLRAAIFCAGGFLPLHRPLPFLFVSAVAVGPAGGKGVLPHKICHTARFAHGVVQTA